MGCIKYVKIFLLTAVLLSISSFKSTDITYELVENNYLEAVMLKSKEKLLAISDKITEKEITGKDGMKFLKLKLRILTKFVEYESSLNLISKYRNFFDNDYELIVAQGLVRKKLNREYDSYFREAFEKLKKKPLKEKTEQELYVEYSLAFCLKITDISLFQDEFYNSLSGTRKETIYYFQNNSEEWMANFPICGFIVISDIFQRFFR